MTKAEQRALEVYPDYPTMDGGYVTQRRTRKVFIQGYENRKDTEVYFYAGGSSILILNREYGKDEVTINQI